MASMINTDTCFNVIDFQEAFPLDENLMRASSSASRFTTDGNDNAYLAFVMGMVRRLRHQCAHATTDYCCQGLRRISVAMGVA